MVREPRLEQGGRIVAPIYTCKSTWNGIIKNMLTSVRVLCFFFVLERQVNCRMYFSLKIYATVAWSQPFPNGWLYEILVLEVQEIGESSPFYHKFKSSAVSQNFQETLSKFEIEISKVETIHLVRGVKNSSELGLRISSSRRVSSSFRFCDRGIADHSSFREEFLLISRSKVASLLRAGSRPEDKHSAAALTF